MGYKIPRPDFTLPPSNFNAAFEASKGVARGIQQYAQYRKESQEKAEKLAQAEREFKNTIMVNQAKTIGTWTATAEKKLGAESEMFKQFQGIVKDKAKQAMAAQVAMQFDKNLSDEERAANAQIVADFDTYTSSSMEQLGGVIADYEAYINKSGMKDQVVVGNPLNGERFFNEVMLSNLGGNGPAQFELGVENFNRTVEAEGTNNIIKSRVTIPVNHPLIAQHKEYLEAGIAEGGKYNFGNIKVEDGMYVFSSTINAGAYASKDGFDFVVPVQPMMDGGKVMRDVGFLNKDNGVVDSNMYQTPYIVSEDLKTSDGKSTGQIETKTQEIVNISSLTLNGAYQSELDGEYAAIFESGQSVSQQAAYLERNLGIVDLPPAWKEKYGSMEKFLAKGTEAEKLNFFKNNIQAEILQKSFPQTDRKQYTDPKTTVQPATGKLLKFLQDNEYMNEYGKPYEEGEPVYMIETLKLTNAPKPESQPKIDQMADLLMKSEEDIIKTLKNAPFGVTNRGSFIIDKDDPKNQIRLIRGDDSTQYPIVSMKEFKDMLRNASPTARN